MKEILEALECISLGKAIGWIMLVVVVFMSFFEFSKIQLNPISAVFRWIGSRTNAELLKAVKGLEKEIGEQKEEIQKLKDEAAEDRAEVRRVRILSFGDELRHNMRHSKECYDQSLKDISDYNGYCDEHPNFKNEMTVATTEVIRDSYKKCLDPDDKDHEFL